MEKLISKRKDLKVREIIELVKKRVSFFGVYRLYDKLEQREIE